MGDAMPGTVCLIGTGGVGKAVAFGLLDLGAEVIRCVDLDLAKAEGLADALRRVAGKTGIETSTDAIAAAKGASGIVNYTPLGMVGIGDTPLARAAMEGATWAFDAVYTRIDTQFLTDEEAVGLQIISGYELFFGQGIDAWGIFTGVALDTAGLREAISEEPT